MRLDLDGKVAVVTGAGGALGGEIAQALAAQGAYVALWDLSPDAVHQKSRAIVEAGGRSSAMECDVADRDQVAAATRAVLADVGAIDILINAAGGSYKDATTSEDLSFFDISPEAMSEGFRLNFTTVLTPCQAVGKIFAKQNSGVILNISSVAGICPLTRAVAYSSAKAALNNFTQWLAVHMARTYNPNIRVNAVAPGFMLTQQNAFLLVDENGEMTDRGRQILSAVPMGRYGEPREVVGAALWLVSDYSSFVTGAVVPVDGGFTACSGV